MRGYIRGIQYTFGEYSRGKFLRSLFPKKSNTKGKLIRFPSKEGQQKSV